MIVLWVESIEEYYIISILYFNVYYVYCTLSCHINKLTWNIDLSLKYFMWEKELFPVWIMTVWSHWNMSMIWFIQAGHHMSWHTSTALVSQSFSWRCLLSLARSAGGYPLHPNKNQFNTSEHRLFFTEEIFMNRSCFTPMRVFYWHIYVI